MENKTKKFQLIKDDIVNPVYKNSYGHELDTVRLELDEFLREPISRIRTFLAMLEEDDYITFGYLGEALIENEERRLADFIDLFNEKVGDVKVDSLKRGNFDYPGKPIGMVVEPINEEEENETDPN